MNEQLFNEIKVCILKYHTDMYYNSIPGYILSFEYGHDGSGENEVPVSKKELISKLRIISDFVHEQVINTKVLGSNFSKYQIEKWGELYEKLIYRGRLYDNVITTHLIQNPRLAELVNESFGNKDEYLNYTQFFRQCMHIGYITAGNRVAKSMDENSIFGYEPYKNGNISVIKIYLNIDGYLAKMDLIKKSNEELNNTLNTYLETHNYYRYIPEKLVDELKTKYIFRSQKTDDCFYYKRRENNLDYIKFDEQDRKNPMVALLGQGQMNLTLMQ